VRRYTTPAQSLAGLNDLLRSGFFGVPPYLAGTAATFILAILTQVAYVYVG